MVMTRETFEHVVQNAFAAIGFSPEAPFVYAWPYALFKGGSDLSPINENIDKIVYGLTKWQPKTIEKGVYAAPKVTVEGKDYEEALANVNNLFIRNMWAEGLPIIAPTEDRVNWILTGTDLAPDTVIGTILNRGGIATVEAIAVALAMAGGRPEYLPVLIAIVEGMLHPDVAHQNMQATTNDCYPMAIVNGPIRKDIRLNRSYGVLGPDPKRPAGGSIGRGLRFLQMNLGGAIPGIGTMATYGGPARYTNVVFAEDEDGIPPNWQPPLSVERGFPEGSNVVTVHVVNGNLMTPKMGDSVDLLAEQAQNLITSWALAMGVMNEQYWKFFNPKGAPGVLLVNRSVSGLVSEAGWTKEDVKKDLWEQSKLPGIPLMRLQVEDSVRRGRLDETDVQWPMPICASPENIIIVVAGGLTHLRGYWMPSGGQGIAPVSVEIKHLPPKAKWDELMKQAEEDLGAIQEDITIE